MKFVIWGVLYLAVSPAWGASFDCAKATAPREKLICSDSSLGEEDEQLAEAYKAAQSRLSEDGRHKLIMEQRAWLRFLSEACPLSATTTEQDRTYASYCLSSFYHQRSEDFEQTGQKIGPFTFTVSAQYRAILPKNPRKTDLDFDNGITTRSWTYPQIDSPLTPEALRWNAKNVTNKDPGSYCEEGGPSDDTRISKIFFATARLISVEWNMGSSCHGAAHGMGGRTAQNWVLSPEPYLLKPGTLFRADRPWQTTLTALVSAAVRKAYVAEYKNEPKDLRQSAIADAAKSPSRWQIGEKGLTVTFDSYELGQGYVFAPSVEIPWEALKDLMAPDAPVFN